MREKESRPFEKWRKKILRRYDDDDQQRMLWREIQSKMYELEAHVVSLYSEFESMKHKPRILA